MAFALLNSIGATADSHIAQQTHDGLVLVPDSKIASAYVDPDADFGEYNKIMMTDCFVAFKKDWQKDQKKPGSRTKVSSSEMEKIKTEVAIMFREVFAEELSKDGGYEIVDDAGDVLARGAGRKVAGNVGGYLTYTNRVTNQADARRMMRSWAKALRERLDAYHGK